MKHFFFAFAVSFLVGLTIVKLSQRMDKLITDYLHLGPQRFHKRPTPRLGGVGILLALLVVGVWAYFEGLETGRVLLIVSLVSIPTFVAGLWEDLTKSLSPRVRLFLISVGSTLAYLLMDAKVVRVDLPFIDWGLSFEPFSFLFTVFALVGLANAINIIDGFNGLASGVSIMVFLAIAYVSYKVGDNSTLLFSLAMVGALLGFFLLNYPYGLIFLGDCGAYLTGFVMGVLLILLVKNNAQVSPWFALTVTIYPVYETVFSVYRRKFLKKTLATAPDSMHLHSIFYKTIVRKLLGHEHRFRNPATSPLVWAMSGFGVIPATLFYDRTPVLILSVLLFVLIYTWVYFSILRSKLPGRL